VKEPPKFRPEKVYKPSDFCTALISTKMDDDSYITCYVSFRTALFQQQFKEKLNKISYQEPKQLSADNLI
jgi:hypothetical protein